MQLIIGFIFINSIIIIFFAEKREKEKSEKAERQRQHELEKAEKAEKAKKAAYALEQQEKAEQQRYTISRRQKNLSNHINYWLNSCNFTIFSFF